MQRFVKRSGAHAAHAVKVDVKGTQVVQRTVLNGQRQRPDARRISDDVAALGGGHPVDLLHTPQRDGWIVRTEALGTADAVEVDLIQIELETGDVFFLCSDGLSNCVDDRGILEISGREISWQEKLHELVRWALENGGNDNITAMYAVFEEDLK